MKTIFYGLVALLCAACHNNTNLTANKIRDGFYEVCTGPEIQGQTTKPLTRVLIPFDPLFAPEEKNEVWIDTAEYVPLELAGKPQLTKQTTDNILLSIRLSANAALKLEAFSSKRILKQAVVVIDQQAITQHKIRDTIRGGNLQITRCENEACSYLFLKMTQGRAE